MVFSLAVANVQRVSLENLNLLEVILKYEIVNCSKNKQPGKEKWLTEARTSGWFKITTNISERELTLNDLRQRSS